MEATTQNQIQTIALRCRETCGRFGAAIDFGSRKFPEKCCGIASLLLAKLLTDPEVINHSYKVRIRSGQMPDGGDDYQHSWIVIDDFVLDITAAQFGAHAPVIFSDDHKWHNTAFPYEQRWELADFDDLASAPQFRKKYERLKSYMMDIC